VVALVYVRPLLRSPAVRPAIRLFLRPKFVWFFQTNSSFSIQICLVFPDKRLSLYNGFF